MVPTAITNAKAIIKIIIEISRTLDLLLLEEFLLGFLTLLPFFIFFLHIFICEISCYILYILHKNWSFLQYKLQFIFIIYEL